MAIRAVFFDLGGTLFSYRQVARGTGPLIREAVRRLGVETERGEIGRAYREASRIAYEKHGHLPYYLHRDLFRDTFRAFAEALGREASDDFLDWFEAGQRDVLIEQMAPRPDARDTVSALREQGLYTSIVSNIDDDYLLPIIEKWKLADLFDHWTSSEEARSCKPDRRFFELALEKAGRPAGEVLFVGDSPEHDIQGARALGMTSVLIVEEGTPPPLQSGAAEHEPHHEIRALGELLELL